MNHPGFLKSRTLPNECTNRRRIFSFNPVQGKMSRGQTFKFKTLAKTPYSYNSSQYVGSPLTHASFQPKRLRAQAPSGNIYVCVCQRDCDDDDKKLTNDPRVATIQLFFHILIRLSPRSHKENIENMNIFDENGGIIRLEFEREHQMVATHGLPVTIIPHPGQRRLHYQYVYCIQYGLFCLLQ